MAIDVNTEEKRQIVQHSLQGFQIQISVKKNVKKKLYYHNKNDTEWNRENSSKTIHLIGETNVKGNKWPWDYITCETYIKFAQ